MWLASSKFTNKEWIAHNGWVQCDTNDIIVCTWNWAWITLAACNVWAKIATSKACTNSSYSTSLNTWSCITDKMWLHFQWWSSTGYKFEETYALSSYTLDSWWTTASTSDIWSQWPCPSWYHIPSPDEWYDVIEAWNWWWWTLWTAHDNSLYYHTVNSRRSRSSWWGDIRTALMLPAAGRRARSNGLYFQGEYGHYWSSVAHASTTSYARNLSFNSSSVYPGTYYNRELGLSLRCFKD
jgi:hypothetical protein